MYQNIKKGLFSFLAAVICLAAFDNSSVALAKDAEAVVDKSEVENGIIVIHGQQAAEQIDKIGVVKDDIIYYYDYNDDIRVPLQSGNGTYKIELYSHVEGSKYRRILSDEVQYDTDDGVTVYLQSTQLVNWDTDMKAVKKAAELTRGKKTDKEKAEAIYNYIVENYRYDNKKAETVVSGYISSVEDTFQSKKGICYDYSVLFASMLRSAGVPVKVLMGRSRDVSEYHAWNEVYLDGSWITVDTTLDSAVSGEARGSMGKKAGRYTIEKQY